MSRRAQIRWGYGTGLKGVAHSAGDLLAALSGPDPLAVLYPVTPLSDVLAATAALRAQRRTGGSMQDANRRLRDMALSGFRAHAARTLSTEQAFRERLTWFWGDHFAISARNLPLRAGAPAYLDTAIRPHVAGRFADMLKAVVTHPAMLIFLDQSSSTGPMSTVGQRRGRGLNENLARELLELHTLGVGAGYAQRDVRELAELLTGLSVDPVRGFVFRAAIAEPGAEAVLGETYGGGAANLGDIHQVLEDLAAHPETATHLATKLARHFTADVPDAGLVADLAAAYRRSDGALLPVYEVLLTHPASLSSFGAKAKQPFEFLMSALLALGATPAMLADLSQRDLRRLILQPLSAMGQPPFQPPGPDGWPEEAEHWIAPQGLATRILWSLRVAEDLGARLPEPERLLEAALGDLAGSRLRFAIGAAETRADAQALVLSSAEFNRR